MKYESLEVYRKYVNGAGASGTVFTVYYTIYNMGLTEGGVALTG